MSSGKSHFVMQNNLADHQACHLREQREVRLASDGWKGPRLAIISWKASPLTPSDKLVLLTDACHAGP